MTLEIGDTLPLKPAFDQVGNSPFQLLKAVPKVPPQMVGCDPVKLLQPDPFNPATYAKPALASQKAAWVQAFKDNGLTVDEADAQWCQPGGILRVRVQQPKVVICPWQRFDAEHGIWVDVDSVLIEIGWAYGEFTTPYNGRGTGTTTQTIAWAKGTVLDFTITPEGLDPPFFNSSGPKPMRLTLTSQSCGSGIHATGDFVVGPGGVAALYQPAHQEENRGCVNDFLLGGNFFFPWVWVDPWTNDFETSIGHTSQLTARYVGVGP